VVTWRRFLAPLGLVLILGAMLLLRARHASTPRALPAASSSALPLALRPNLRLLVMTDLDGVLEPCGCTRDQLGGLDRLAAAVAQERSDGVPALLLSAGRLFFDPGSQSPNPVPTPRLWQAETTADILRQMGLAAAGLDARDLAHGHAFLATLASRSRASWLAAGVLLEREASQDLNSAAAIASAPLEPVKASELRSIGGLRVGLVGALAKPTDGFPRGVRASDDAASVALGEVAQLRAQGVDAVIALTQIDASDVVQLAAPGGADFIVVSGDRSESYARPVERAWALHAAHEGQGLLAVDLWLRTRGAPFSELDAARLGTVNELRARYRDLPQSAPRDPTVRAALDGLAKRVNDYNRTAFADVAPAPIAKDQAGFVGSRPCAACHTAEYIWWTSSAHGAAYAALARRDKQYDLDCVSCHVTGYGKPGGSTLTHVEALANVGCESCHGPGSTHIADARPPHRFIHRSVPETLCKQCHDATHSHGFDFEAYSAKLRVPGHGLPLGH
jgi:2',3'-cyclic-nucleotide 2'-phosphodiesterase (5'-nucleotidase family)